jgi:glyoxylase-like metal-dependent hydrolase (beta-lactamase superfamily II)
VARARHPEPGGAAQRRGVRASARRGQPGRGLAASQRHGRRGISFSAGDQLPVGVAAFPGKEANDVVLWVENRGTVIAGDTLVDFGQGLEIPPEWLPDGVTPKQVTEGLRPLLERPVEHVLATHGGPSDRAALERALS